MLNKDISTVLDDTHRKCPGGIVILDKEKSNQTGAIWLKAGREGAVQMPGWGGVGGGRLPGRVQGNTGVPQRAWTSQFREQQAAREAGGNEQVRTAAKLRAEMNGRAVCADHAVLFMLLYISLGFYLE